MKQTSLKSFGNLITELDQSNATARKVSIISEFIIDIDPRDGAWVLLLLMGNHNKRLITGRRLREILQEASKMPRWLFDDCFTQVGDSAETISLLWPQLNHLSSLLNQTLAVISLRTVRKQRKQKYTRHLTFRLDY